MAKASPPPPPIDPAPTSIGWLVAIGVGLISLLAGVAGQWQLLPATAAAGLLLVAIHQTSQNMRLRQLLEHRHDPALYDAVRGYQPHLLNAVAPTKLLDTLRGLLQANGWLLTNNQDVLLQHNLTPAHRPAELQTGIWLHQGDESWLRLVRDGQEYILALQLPDRLTREAARRYLEQLPFDRQQSEEGPESRANSSFQIVTNSIAFMAEGMIVTDILGNILFCNGTTESWLRQDQRSLTGMSLATLLHSFDPRDNPPWQETVGEVLTLHEKRAVYITLQDRDFVLHLNPFPLPDFQRYGIVATLSDITELKDQQRQHREAIDFISHDVRSPLVSQLALIEQLKRHNEPVQPEQVDQLGRLARRSYQLAEQFVQLARAEQLTETRFYECELLSIVENANDSVLEQAAGKQITLKLLGQEDLWLRGNAELLERVVINLLTNAISYSPEGSTVNIQVFRAGHEACITVSDEGMGIDEADIPQLFDRFTRRKTTELSGSHHGAGLGLSFVKVVIDKHKGRIGVVSMPGEGTTFTLRLPVLEPLPEAS